MKNKINNGVWRNKQAKISKMKMKNSEKNNESEKKWNNENQAAKIMIIWRRHVVS